MNGQGIRMGMVGGGRGAFIGGVHRIAAGLDPSPDGMRLVAGCFSSTPEKARASGRELGVSEGRNYATWEEMLARERALPAGERIDLVSIVTPNHVHAPVALAFTRAGFHVVSDKPLCVSSSEASELVSAWRSAGTIFGVTYNYSGYPMVKQARHMVAQGEIGEVRKVIVEYNQGWLASRLEAAEGGGGHKQADWRTDPARSGAGGAIGDIGSHAEQLVHCITGLEVEEICADLSTMVTGRRLDDDANLLLRFGGGARGVLIASQIEVGHENDLRIRVFGTKGTLEWRQEEPNELWHRAMGEPDRVLRRGNAYLCEAARGASRLPPGHPEAFLEAFANIYNAVAADIRHRRAGLGPKKEGGGETFDYPTVIDGARGVMFIERTVESSNSASKWTGMRR